jgi:AcrR family transcriptional regulator
LSLAQAVPLKARPAPAAARRQDSRERMLAAAATAFCASGYFAVTVEDIASAAGVSRMTVYRHFNGKAALAFALFEQNVAAWLPRFLAIRQQHKLDQPAVARWIGDLFEADRESGQLLWVFMQANAEGTAFTAAAQGLIGRLIVALGETLPAFALDREAAADRRRWLEAWLLIYEILDQSNHAARGVGASCDPLVIDILADRFVRFVQDGPA